MSEYQSLFEDNWEERSTEIAKDLRTKIQKFLQEELIPEVIELNISLSDLELFLHIITPSLIIKGKIERMLRERKALEENETTSRKNKLNDSERP